MRQLILDPAFDLVMEEKETELREALRGFRPQFLGNKRDNN